MQREIKLNPQDPQALMWLGLIELAESRQAGRADRAWGPPCVGVEECRAVASCGWILRSGEFFNEDFSINKRTKITERTDILFSTDLLNAFNRHVFARPITSGPGDINGFGVISTTAYPSAFTNSNSFARIVQFTLKVEF